VESRRPSVVHGPEQLVQAVAREGVRHERILDALRAVRREQFVPIELSGRAYRDVPLPIPRDQVTTQPSLVAKMLEALAPHSTDTVLEVGTGYGYQTALLAELARHVWSVERWPDLAAAARQNLLEHGASNVTVITGDGSGGLPDHAPFDGIVVSATFTSVPAPFVQQLAPGGRLVQPIGPGGAEEVVLFAKEGDSLVRRATVTGAHFVRLYGKHGFRSVS
jgi:protein-L-isoaspartate(D-aspartate) O-methyltransferase